MGYSMINNVNLTIYDQAIQENFGFFIKKIFIFPRYNLFAQLFLLVLVFSFFFFFVFKEANCIVETSKNYPTYINIYNNERTM